MPLFLETQLVKHIGDKHKIKIFNYGIIIKYTKVLKILYLCLNLYQAKQLRNDGHNRQIMRREVQSKFL